MLQRLSRPGSAGLQATLQEHLEAIPATLESRANLAYAGLAEKLSSRENSVQESGNPAENVRRQ